MIQGDRKHYYLPSTICPSSSGHILHLELQCCTFDYIGGLQRVPPASQCTHTNIHQAISFIWSYNAVLLIRLEAYSVYLPSLSMYTYQHTSGYIPHFGAAVLYFWLHWRPTACTYPSQFTHANIHQAISPIWSCNAVLLIRLQAYSVYLPSLSMYTCKHTSGNIPHLELQCCTFD